MKNTERDRGTSPSTAGWCETSSGRHQAVASGFEPDTGSAADTLLAASRRGLPIGRGAPSQLRLGLL